MGAGLGADGGHHAKDEGVLVASATQTRAAYHCEHDQAFGGTIRTKGVCVGWLSMLGGHDG